MTLSRRVLLLWVEFHCQKCPAFSLKTATLKSIMAKNLFFLVLFSLFLASNGETFSSIKGYYLPGYELGEIFTSDWFECINKCNPNADCISYNFNLRESLCQLNTRGIDHLTYVADRTLNHNDDYIFHQLKTPKNDQLASPRSGCSDQHCHTTLPAPGIGDVPEMPAASCKAILSNRSNVKNGPYYLATFPMTQVYCHMDELPGCGGGGWTLVMKIDGTKETFQYNSTLWTKSMSYNDQEGKDLNERETLLSTYWSILQVNKTCLGMKYNDETRWISLNHSGDNKLRDVMKTKINTTLKLETWKSLLTNSSLEKECVRQGFNIQESESHQVRIGILGYHKSDCAKGMSTSLLGFGISDSSHSCGNKAAKGSYADNGERSIAAFGYVFLQ